MDLLIGLFHAPARFLEAWGRDIRAAARIKREHPAGDRCRTCERPCPPGDGICGECWLEEQV